MKQMCNTYVTFFKELTNAVLFNNLINYIKMYEF